MIDTIAQYQAILLLQILPSMTSHLLLLSTCLAILQPTTGYSTGASTDACLSLHPGHGGDPGDPGDAPYQLIVSNTHLREPAQTKKCYKKWKNSEGGGD